MNDISAKINNFGIGELGQVPPDTWNRPQQSSAMYCEECGSRNVKNWQCQDCGERDMLQIIEYYEAWTHDAGEHWRIEGDRFTSAREAIEYGRQIYGDDIALYGADTPTINALRNVYAKRV